MVSKPDITTADVRMFLLIYCSSNALLIEPLLPKPHKSWSVNLLIEPSPGGCQVSPESDEEELEALVRPVGKGVVGLTSGSTSS